MTFLTDTSKLLLILIMDKSGSMGDVASKDIECLGFTRNDFARQGAMLCVNACPESMYMGVVAFDSSAVIVSQPAQMSITNKNRICQDIKLIKPNGGTEIMSAMIETKKLIEQARINFGITQTSVIMFTDGEDNALNDVNVSSQFERLKTNHEYGFNMDTVGFGPNANTQLLVKMAGLCSGTYSLCFDASMVGTIFGRALARTYLRSSAFGIQETSGVKTTEYYTLREVYHDFRMNMSELLLKTNYRLLSERVQAVNLFNSVLEEWLLTTQQNEITQPDWYGSICALHVDLNDQIRIAVSDPIFWSKWGKAYWQTIGIALEKQYAPNFKDNCLQIFGSDQAKNEYERISKLYDEMTMITPSNIQAARARTTAIPSTSRMFNERDSGCFHPKSTVTLFNGENVNIEIIELMFKSGQFVFIFSKTHGLVPIEAIIKTKMSSKSTKFCKIDSTVLTPNHPILINNKWFHPKTITHIYEEQVDYVFNLVLGINPLTNLRYQSVMINNNECVCLGHGILEDPVASDDFWGSEVIINKIKNLYPNEYNRNVVNFNHEFVRNEKTGWIDKIM